MKIWYVYLIILNNSVASPSLPTGSSCLMKRKGLFIHCSRHSLIMIAVSSPLRSSPTLLSSSPGPLMVLCVCGDWRLRISHQQSRCLNLKLISLE